MTKNVIQTIAISSFKNCIALTAFPSETTITSIASNGFQGCRAVTNANFESLQTIGNYAFDGCYSMTVFNAPKLKSVGDYGLMGCTGLTSVTFGSTGNAVTSISSKAFYQCTQTGVTITVYTTGGYVDTHLANIRNYATHATIIIKASANTTYNGTTYLAGETIVTSEVA